MRAVSVNTFRSQLKSAIDQVARSHEPLHVTRRGGADFVVISHEDWQAEQETLYVLQNRSLMQQIARSLVTHEKGEGYVPTTEELDEIDRI